MRTEADLRLEGWLDGYHPLPGVPDELLPSGGRPSESWTRLLGALAAFPEREFADRFALATRHIRDAGVSHRVYGEANERLWPLSPLPLILGQAEWAGIAEGIAQRATLLEAVLSDLYGPATLVGEGHLPAAAVTGSPDFIRSMRGVPVPGGRPLHLYAADLGRGPDGRWWVLGDRTQAPSGMGYALETRLVLSRALPQLHTAMNVERLAPFFAAFRASLAAAAPRADPRICLLTPGPYSQTYFEQAHLARYLGFLLVEGDDLVARDDKVFVRTIAGLKRADILWRRVDADYIDPLELNGASHLGVPGLMDAVRAGGVVVSNMPGSGLIESRALLAFLPALARRLLGEPLKLPNVATWWCGQEAAASEVGARLDTLAVARAFAGHGHTALAGGARLLGDLKEQDRAEVRDAMAARPIDYVGQEVVRLSTTPAWRNGRLTAAPFTLRVYAVATPQGWRVMPGGFCRISSHPDARAISMNSAEVADVWVLADTPVERVTLMARSEDVRVRRLTGTLPARAADNLFWLGRYLERAEATLRLVRALFTRLVDAHAERHETLDRLRDLLIDWGAVEDEFTGSVTDAGLAALCDEKEFGSAVRLIRSARRVASSLRERLSEDFWTQLNGLETRLGGCEADNPSAALDHAQTALDALAGLAGLTHENMNRTAGWHFLDTGRRIERGINACRVARALGHDSATSNDLDLLLDLADSQITYRARYLEGVALTPVRDMVLLDPHNPRSLAFQVTAARAHLEALPSLRDDGMPERPLLLLRGLTGELEAANAADLGEDRVEAVENTLLALGNAVADRYFLHGSNAVHIRKLGGLA